MPCPPPPPQQQKAPNVTLCMLHRIESGSVRGTGASVQKRLFLAPRTSRFGGRILDLISWSDKAQGDHLGDHYLLGGLCPCDDGDLCEGLDLCVRLHVRRCVSLVVHVRRRRGARQSFSKARALTRRLLDAARAEQVVDSVVGPGEASLREGASRGCTLGEAPVGSWELPRGRGCGPPETGAQSSEMLGHWCHGTARDGRLPRGHRRRWPNTHTSSRDPMRT